MLIVLLGIQTAIKENLSATAAEIVYGTGIRLPTEFFLTADQHANSKYANRLKESIEKLKPHPIIGHSMKKIFIFRELASSAYVFLRHDAAKSSLQLPYDGPYKVIQRGDKNFTIEITNRNLRVSIDRLKPAFVEPDDIEQQQQDEICTEIRDVFAQPETQNSRNEERTIRSEENPKSRYTMRSGRKVRFPGRFQADYK